MAYIPPGTDVYLFRDMPLDNSYDHTVWFDSVAAQTAAFLAYSNKSHFTDISYQRSDPGKMRLQGNPDTYMNYNYMMYRNAAYSEKWYYAFIKKVNYINDNTFEVEFEIDELQTWLFSLSLQPCFVERETAATDNPGDNVVAESLDIGPIKCYETQKTTWFDNNAVLITYAPRSN